MSEAVKILIFDSRISIAATALYFYDKILTSQQEVNLIWRRKNTGIVIPVIYGIMHVCTAVYLLITVCVPSDIPCKTSAILNIVVDIAICALYLAWGGTSLVQDITIQRAMMLTRTTAASALRVYAINGLRLPLPSIIMLLSLVPVAINIYNATSLVRMSLPPTDECVYFSNTPVNTQETREPLRVIVTRASSTVADALVLFATWRINGGTKKLARQMNINISLTSLLLRDGTIYFCTLLVANIIVLTSYIQSISFSDDSEVAVLVLVLTTILLSRLFLNLREVALGSETVTLETQDTERSDLRFSRYIGPLGNSLDDGLTFAADGSDSYTFDHDDGTSYGDHSAELIVDGANSDIELSLVTAVGGSSA
ncbi:uncharacterized protein B0H18DRAFT_1124132 [Fomitopsis serialis]|uniref:uncharacterized protein n=1 Tax=Fomitopsis serialis TaxID=139415 RepID=UPI002008AC64|nr:uncharacterized protein B0H18DRAFT_1124132 [Neoantrodia serialis]KAH9916647.1 hypothetical protein B0H18DRAFT_1124132 [Neoantrodia serialis]